MSIKIERIDDSVAENKESTNDIVNTNSTVKVEPCDENQWSLQDNTVEVARKRQRDESPDSSQAPRALRNRVNSESSTSTNSSCNNEKRKIEYETDEVVLARRQKEIDYGKNTIGYDRYLQLVPRDQRTKDHPKTPPKHAKYSRRGWDGMIKLWRKQLHHWDPPEDENSEMMKVEDKVEQEEDDEKETDMNVDLKQKENDNDVEMKIKKEEGETST